VHEGVDGTRQGGEDRLRARAGRNVIFSGTGGARDRDEGRRDRRRSRWNSSTPSKTWAPSS
jgi:hypothetical protein